MKLNRAYFLGIVLCVSSLGSYARAETRVVLSPVYTIDRIYKSMEGPESGQTVALLDGETPELVWITGFKTEMMGEDGKTPTKPEFMCHVNLDLDTDLHKKLFNSAAGNRRILTLSQGQLEAYFPKGFGLPVMSNQPLYLNTQVLNHNDKDQRFLVRHKVTFEFVRDKDLIEPMKPLFNTSGFGMKVLEGTDGHFGISQANEAKHGPSCLPGDSAPNAGGGSVYKDQFQKRFTGHWVVKPGREVNHTNITQYLNLPYDTELHYAAVHLHPYATSLEMRDLTTGKTVFKTGAESFKKKIGLVRVESFSSAEGVKLFKNHQYDLISTYNNTTSTDKDSMAVALLFLRDKNFRKPSADPVPLSEADQKLLKSKAVYFRTTAGDFVATLNGETAPRTALQFAKYVEAGLYNGVRLLTFLPDYLVQTSNVYSRSTPLDPMQTALLKPIAAEPKAGSHKRGTLSMTRNPADPAAAETSFCVLLKDAPHLDAEFSAFGQITRGFEVFEALSNWPRDVKNEILSDPRIEVARLVTLKDAQKLKLRGPQAPPKAAPPQARGDGLRLKTSVGEMTFRLFPVQAPKTVEQILLLAQAGVYDTTHISRVEPGFVAQLSVAEDRREPLSENQRKLIRKLPLEKSSLRHHRGVLSMARQDRDPHSAETSFSILLGNAPHLDGNYTIFGELESGQETLAAIEKISRTGTAPSKRLEVQRLEVIRSAALTEAPQCHPGEEMAKTPVLEIIDPSVTVQPRVKEGDTWVKRVLFKDFVIDRMYPSMLGPWKRAYLSYESNPKNPFVWITAYRAEVLEGGTEKASQEFMCHTKLDVVPAPTAAGFPAKYESQFVISQGQEEVQFPKGFALRLPNDPHKRLDINAMVLNNLYPTIHKKLDFQATVRYIENDDAVKTGLVPLQIQTASIHCPVTECKPAAAPAGTAKSSHTGHWLVPPGRHVYRSVFRSLFPRDTRLHYAMVHLHPYAESLELRDLTSGKTVWIGKIKNSPDQKALVLSTDFYSSPVGLPVYRDHAYELVSVYNNPLKQDIDAMASLWMYVRIPS